MKFIYSLIWTTVFALSSYPLNAAQISLFEWDVNVNGVIDRSLINAAGFDQTTGLGTIELKINDLGTHSVDFFFDHEIDESTNTYFNESGSVTGTAAAGQSWEIDEPGFLFGDIYDNFLASTLDNFNNVPSGMEDDVSIGLGWDFVLGVDEMVTISVVISEAIPLNAFYLTQHDPDSNASIYFSSTVSINPISQVPVPAAFWLMFSGLMGMLGFNRVKVVSV